MRVTQVQFAQHLGRMWERSWQARGKRVPLEHNFLKDLPALGINAVDINEVVKEEIVREKIHIVGYQEDHVPLDKNHPLYKERKCHKYENFSVLLRGLEQAKCITKSVEVKQGLPTRLESMIGSQEFLIPNQDELVQSSILASHVFDAYQTKLPKLFDPERPAWNFRRVYGISDKRKTRLMCEKLVQLCSPLYSGRMFAITNSQCSVPVEKNNELILCELNMDMLLMSSSPLTSVASAEDEKLAAETPLLDLSPINPTITLKKTNFYDPKNISPVNNAGKFNNIHTILIHYNDTQIHNLYETPVKETQILGRSLMHTFAAAASQARLKFGVLHGDLPSPIVVQSIQTDGRVYDMVVFQLNTLNLSDLDGKKNMLWMLPRQELFAECKYKGGKPTLEGYNPEVFNVILAMLANS